MCVPFLSMMMSVLILIDIICWGFVTAGGYKESTLVSDSSVVGLQDCIFKSSGCCGTCMSSLLKSHIWSHIRNVCLLSL